MSTADDVLSVALSLPTHDRAIIAERLLASLDSEREVHSAAEAWGEEIVARAAAYEQGKVTAAPWREALAGVRRSGKCSTSE